MKKAVVISLVLFLIGILSFLSCNKKKPGMVYTTKSGNSTIMIGDTPCWTFDSCNVMPGRMRGVCGGCTVELVIGGSPSIGTYAFTSGIPTAGQACLKIVNPPGQLSETWFSRSGSVITNTTTTGWSATFTNVNCIQHPVSNPTVIASGTMVCL